MSTASTRSEVPAAATVVLHVGRQFRASEKAVAETALLRQARVSLVQANRVVQTTTVRYDPSVTSVAELRRTAERAGFECQPARVDPHRVPGVQHNPVHAVIAAIDQVAVACGEVISHAPNLPACALAVSRTARSATPSGRSPGRSVGALATCAPLNHRG
jgi:hypothetical protein